MERALETAHDGPRNRAVMTETSVMDTPLPTLRPENAVEAAAKLFGVFADEARSLGCERDQVFWLTRLKVPLAVMKVSNAAEDPEILDLEAAAAFHAMEFDPTLAIALPHRVLDGDGHRGQYHHDGKLHWIRCYDVVPGVTLEATDGPLDDTLLREWGGMCARLGVALRGFTHPRATRKTMWDVQHAATLLPPFLPHVSAEKGLRAVCADVLRAFEEEVRPRLATLRHQVIHGDLNLNNVMVLSKDSSGGTMDASGLLRRQISGIIDFGDMSFTVLAADIATMLTALGTAHVARGAHDLLRMARVLVDGYQQVCPLEEEELLVLADLWMARCCAEVLITSQREGNGVCAVERAERSAAERPLIETQLRILHALGREGRAACLTTAMDPAAMPSSTSELILRRQAAIGHGSEPLSYLSISAPVVVVRATGCWVVDAAGTTLLDCYNNVPSVGHAHPRVAQAIARQARKANTNLRYLHPLAVSLAERLKASLPAHLDTVFFVNSGSEANDLAWRMSVAWTARARPTTTPGALCTAHAYHGISEATVALSPETTSSAGHLPAHVERWAPPDAYRSPPGLSSSCPSVGAFSAAIARLEAKGCRLAMSILDGVMQSDGVLQLEPADVQALVMLTQRAGGLWCADEVQGGHGRIGTHMWSFERFGIAPDIVTMGKPMGNGHPVAAVVVRREVAEHFVKKEGVFFSTFGGNPVSCAAAHAVLDVLEDEGVLARTVKAGEALRAQCRRATADIDCVGDVRGVGLANGIELVTDRASKRPDPSRAAWVKNGLRRRGVLVGCTGPHDNVLKIRPPLAFTAAEVPTFVAALVAALNDPMPARPDKSTASETSIRDAVALAARQHVPTQPTSKL